MSHPIAHTIQLQDGSLCNLNRRISKQQVSLLALLTAGVTDPRRLQGTRHSVALILLIVLTGLLTGSKDLKDSCLYARLNLPWFKRIMGHALPHGIPDPVTVSRVLGRLDPEELVTVTVQFLETVRIPLGEVYSFDGKTIRAVSGKQAIRHILSLFSHETHVALGQIGVTGKENEIPAFARLLAQGQTLHTVVGRLFIGDALHTQKATCKHIVQAHADYLFTVKNNQRKLKQTIVAELEQRSSHSASSLSTYTSIDHTRGRHITTTVTLVAASAVSPSAEAENLLPTLTGSNHWDGVATMGILHRRGTRRSKDGTPRIVDETIGFISSRVLSAEAVATHLHHHWCIENNLHWVKDAVLGEDKHTLRRGNAPQVMSWLRSLIITLCNGLRLQSLSDTIHHLQKSPTLFNRFLRFAAIV